MELIGKVGFYIVLMTATLGAWLQHVVYCITYEKWFFLIAGAIMAPIGIVHGWGIWFGWW